MFGKVPAYTDISHFRAPYKNAMIAGFGGYQGYGQEPPPPPPPPPPPAPNGQAIPSALPAIPAGTTPSNGGLLDLLPGLAQSLDPDAIISTDDNGYRTLNPKVRPMVMEALKRYGVSELGGANNLVKIYPFSHEQMTAAYGPDADPKVRAYLESISVYTWCGKQVAAGNVVFMSLVVLFMVINGAPLPSGLDEIGTYPAGSDAAKDAARSQIGVVLAGNPDGAGMALAGPIGIAIAVVVAAGGIYWLTTRKRSGGGAPIASF